MTGEQADGARRRERQKAQTRTRVLDAARGLFTQHGYEAVTIRMIADAAGIAVGSVFTTFLSKSDVLSAIVVEELEAHIDDVDAALVGVVGVLARLNALFSAMYRYHDRHIDLLVLGNSHSWVRAPEAERAARRAIAPTVKRIERVLIEGREAGEIAPDADIRTVVDVLYASFISNYRGAAYDGLSAEDMTARMQRQTLAVLRGCGLKG